MAKIVIVHGIAQQYLGPNTLATSLVAATADGVHLVGGPVLAPHDVKIAFYGDYFRPSGAKVLVDEFIAEADDGFVRELLLAWWEAAAEAEPERVPPPGRSKVKVPTPITVQHALDALSHSRFLSGMADKFLIGVAGQVRRYLTEPTTRQIVRSRVEASVGPDTTIMVGHSLGSVIAYEALCANPDWPVHSFVTLGSPLAIRNIVFERLIPAPTADRGLWPSSVVHWTNVCDRYDVVALVKRLGPLFSETSKRKVKDRLVDNGWKAHDLVRHLTARETGEALVEGLGTVR